MYRTVVVTLWTAVCLAALPAVAAEQVVLRLPGGRLLHAADHDTLRADSLIPTARDTFELVSRSKQQIAVKGPDGRWLVPDGRDGQTPRLELGPVEAGDRQTFELVPIAAGRFALRGLSSGALLAFDPAAKPLARAPAGPWAGEIVEIYRIRELPTILQTAVPAIVQGLVAGELMGKEYDKTRKHDVEKYINLPDPTLKDLKRMKRHKVLGLTEETRVQAKLDGPPEVRMPAMPLLVGCGEGGACLMLFAVQASLPVEGHVQYKVPDAASASTGYHTTIRISAVAEVALEHSGKDVTIGSPVLLNLDISLAHLKLSNDLLDAVRRQIERYVNHELRHNEAAMREKANQSLKKALSSHEVRIPLIGYLGLM